jgi:putative transposase
MVAPTREWEGIMKIKGRRGVDRGLHRFEAVSLVRGFAQRGCTIGEAIDRVCAAGIPDEAGGIRKVKRAALYRWYRAFTGNGFDALLDRPRVIKSYVLPQNFTNFLLMEKSSDPEASIPEVIRRAVERGIVGENDQLDRTTAYRAARRLNLPIFRKQRLRESAARPFAYSHRMQMVMCDGKHFRAGASRLKRVALFFIDDATSFVLDAFVGTEGETSELFLRGLYEIIKTYGFMGIIYLDGGPGFKADDTKCVIAAMNVHLIHGKARYPEGHGKIERFNQTVLHQVLRGLRKPEIDPDPKSLELRLRHYIRERYNKTNHEGIGGIPHEKFMADEKELNFPPTEEDLRRHFVIADKRRVRNDNVIPYDDVIYEVPLGHAGRDIQVYRDIISNELSVLHDGKAVKIFPADLAANARERREAFPAQMTPRGPITTAAEIHFNRDHGPIVGPDGGFTSNDESED